MKASNLLIGIFCILATTACKDIFEEDLKDKTIKLIAPSNNVATEIAEQTFFWTTVEGTLYYNLQIVYPGYSAIEKIILDTMVTLNHFNFKLTPGRYEWRVEAINNSSSCVSETFILNIIKSEDISRYTVQLTTPVNSTATTTNITFSWLATTNAKNYIFEIWSPDWQSGTNIDSVIIPGTSYSINHLNNGKYVWGVKAINETSGTLYTTQSFYIDSIAPATPTLKLPADNDTTTTATITMSWSRGLITTSASPVHDSLYITNQANNLIAKIQTNDSTYAFTPTGNGVYYWYVLSIDAAENKSTISSKYKLTKE